MRFMMIVKSSESKGFPPKELMDAIGAISEEAVKDGTMISSGGLLPTAQGARVLLRDGKVTTVDGPFAEAKEVIGGFAIFELNSLKEAVDRAERFMELHRKYWPGWEGGTEIRPMFGPGDLPGHCQE
ncbi:MAG: hypothetical protein JSS69_08390 [Acidobacteria bacterium]|nr:hypothetical protein [Acidobacteriota bacterium]MBS1865923.1 hypothetical protein [Acidobacteriota bacterium]